MAVLIALLAYLFVIVCFVLLAFIVVSEFRKSIMRNGLMMYHILLMVLFFPLTIVSWIFIKLNKPVNKFLNKQVGKRY